MEEKKLLTREEAEKYARKHERHLKLMNSVEFRNTTIITPEIDFYPDEEQFFDPNLWNIHLGYIGIVTRFEATNEQDFYSATDFVRQHETEHVLSTASTPYRNGINMGVQAIIDYIALKEDNITNPARKFKRGESDIIKYLESLKERGIYIKYNDIVEFASGIANSVEDGRIEGKRALKDESFRELRTYYRGMFWRQGENDKLAPYSELDAAEKLRITSNQILILSTCQLYQPNFFMTYVGTPFIEEINELMPYIAKGITAKTCREMSEQVINICRHLAPLVYDAYRMSKDDIEKAEMLSRILKDLISKAIEGNLKDIKDIKEQTEEKGSGEIPSVFGTSDLVITLPDEEYDKLMENAKEGENESGSGIKVRREHPKEDEEKETKDSKESEGSGSSSEDKKSEDFKDSKKGDSSSDSESEDDKDGKAGKGSTKSEDKKSEDSKSEDGGESKSEGSDESATDSENSSKKTGESSKRAESHSDSEMPKTEKKTKDELDEAKKAVEKAMKEAAEKTDYNAKNTVDDINTDITHDKREFSKKEVKDTDKPVSAKDVADICPGFIELKRAYNPTERMPAVLEARCRAMYRKTKRYFKSLSTPNVSHLDSGSIDPSLIYGLSFGDNEVFRKRGIDKVFDGCAYILLDNSGSMMGNKRLESAKAAATIETAFSEIMPLKIVAFDDDYGGTVIHEVIKGWNERLRYNCCYNYALKGRQGSGNNDGYDIEIATRELLGRPEHKKMLVILSDGQPDPGTPEHVKRAVAKARKQGIAVYSIYFNEGSIGSDAETFKYMYEKDYVCCTLDKVDEELNKLFKRFSRR